MLSEMALEDMAELEGEGIKLTPEDIVTLNELGLRVERSATSSDIIAVPRIGWAGDVPIYEPTLQSEAWCDTYAQRWFQDSDEYASAVLFACAHARVRGYFQCQDLQTPEGTVTAMKAWHSGLNVTQEQLKTALSFALFGNTSGSDIYPVESVLKAKKETKDITAEDIRILIQDEILAAGLGISLEDMQTLSESRLWQLLKKYQRNQGVSPSSDKIKAHAEYARTLLAIKKKHLAEVANG